MIRTFTSHGILWKLETVWDDNYRIVTTAIQRRITFMWMKKCAGWERWCPLWQEQFLRPMFVVTPIIGLLDECRIIHFLNHHKYEIVWFASKWKYNTLVELLYCVFWFPFVDNAWFIEVIQLNDDNFETLTQMTTGSTTGRWFIKFYAPVRYSYVLFII